MAFSEVPSEAFWRWCSRAGITSKHLAIGYRNEASSVASKQRIRGLFTKESLSPGSIVAVIPFRACISMHSVSQARFSPAVPSPSILSFAFPFRKFGFGGGELQKLWLTAVIASMCTNETTYELYRPYFELFPKSFSSQDQWIEEFSALHFSMEKLSELQDVKDGVLAISKRLSHLMEAIAAKKKLDVLLPTVHAVHWAQQLVLSRAVDLPEFCFPTAPFPVEDVAVEHPKMRFISAFVPVLDLLNPGIPSPLLLADDDPNENENEFGIKQFCSTMEKSHIISPMAPSPPTGVNDNEESPTTLHVQNPSQTKKSAVGQEDVTSPRANVDMYTCVQQTKTPQRFASSPADVIIPDPPKQWNSKMILDDRKVVLITNQFVPKDGELLLTAHDTDEEVQFVYRHGISPRLL